MKPNSSSFIYRSDILEGAQTAWLAIRSLSKISKKSILYDRETMQLCRVLILKTRSWLSMNIRDVIYFPHVYLTRQNCLIALI